MKKSTIGDISTHTAHENINNFEHFNIQYERTFFYYADVNFRIGSATRDLLLGFYLPKFLWPVGKLFVNAIMDDRLCKRNKSLKEFFALLHAGFNRPAGRLKKGLRGDRFF